MREEVNNPILRVNFLGDVSDDDEREEDVEVDNAEEDELEEETLVEEDRHTSTSARVPMPQNRTRFLRLVQVKEATGLSRTSIYRMVADGSFPRPIHLGPKWAAWVEAEVQKWMDDLASQDRGVGKVDLNCSARTSTGVRSRGIDRARSQSRLRRKS